MKLEHQDLSLCLRDAHFSAKGAILAKPCRGCVGISGCSVFLHPAEEIHCEKVQSGTCGSGPDIVSISLLSAGSLECQEERGRGVCVLVGALGCPDGP